MDLLLSWAESHVPSMSALCKRWRTHPDVDPLAFGFTAQLARFVSRTKDWLSLVDAMATLGLFPPNSCPSASTASARYGCSSRSFETGMYQIWSSLAFWRLEGWLQRRLTSALILPLCDAWGFHLCKYVMGHILVLTRVWLRVQSSIRFEPWWISSRDSLLLCSLVRAFCTRSHAYCSISQNSFWLCGTSTWYFLCYRNLCLNPSCSFPLVLLSSKVHFFFFFWLLLIRLRISELSALACNEPSYIGWSSCS